jgi:tRNA pseudouridine55 synthase
MTGVLIIDKPSGPTSHDVVARVRRAASTRRVGHAGTLDPFATGVLVVCIGGATRLVQFLVGLDKEYIATVRLGLSTDTQDLTGRRLGDRGPAFEIDREHLLRLIEEFRGVSQQMPPMFSAKKVHGERLHRAARAGRVVDRLPATITIHAIALLDASVRKAFKSGEDGTADFSMRVRCSSGTYIRTLAADLGERLGVGAHLAALRRTAVGQFDLKSAVTLDEMDARAAVGELEELLIGPSDALAHLPELRFEPDQVRVIRNGGEVEPPAATREFGPLRLCDSSGRLVAIGDYDDSVGRIHPRVVIAETDRASS